MNNYRTLLINILLLTQLSCDTVKPLYLVNKGEAKTVEVFFNTAGSIFFDSDTLINQYLTSDSTSFIVRNNLKSGHYSFKIKPNQQVILEPKAVNRNPIDSIKIIVNQDSIRMIRLREYNLNGNTLTIE